MIIISLMFFLVRLKVSDGGTVNLLSKSCGVYNVNELGFQKRQAELVEEPENSEKVYRCSSQEMHIFGTIGSGASSVVQRAIHMTIHRVLALKKINVFEKVLCMPLVHFYSLVLCFTFIYNEEVISNASHPISDSNGVSVESFR